MKKISTILFFLWSIFLIVFITFGSSVASKVYEYVHEKLNQEEFGITDIEFELEDEYLVGTAYHLNYTVFPNNNIDHGLKFESLDPDIFAVTSTGYITGKRTSEEKTTGKLKITSSKDLLFEKIIELNFKKTYPSDIKVSLSKTFKQANGVYTVYLDTPVDLIFSIVGVYSQITEKTPQIIYDEEVFEKAGTYVFVPKKKVEETAITVKLHTFEKTLKLKVIDVVDDPEMYELNSQITKFTMTQGKNSDGIYYTNANIYGKLYNGDYNIIAPHTFESSDPEIATISNHTIVPKKAGEVTITATLFNGVKVSKTIQIRNKMYLPEITGLDFDGNNTVDVYSNEPALIDVVFPTDSKYKKYEIIYNEEELNFKKESDYQYHLTALKEGTYTFKVLLDDGYSSIEETYTLNVTKNSKFIYYFRIYLPTIVPKVMGHMVLFAVEGLLGVLFLICHLRHKFRNFLIFIFTGIFCAGFTELIQVYIPGRSGRWEDVIFDLTGYILGALAFALVYLVVYAIVQLIIHLFIKKTKKA